MHREKIRIRTRISGLAHGAMYVRAIVPHGFELFENCEMGGD
jgi:hypothetical protein